MLLGSQKFRNVMYWDWPFYHHDTSYFIARSDYCFKVYSIWYCYSYTIFLLLNFCLMYIFHLFTFNISGSLYLKCVFCKRYIIRFGFVLIFSQTICILIVVFSLFTFNDTADIIWFKSLTYSPFSTFPPTLFVFLSFLLSKVY